MKKSEFKTILTKICVAYDILSQCETVEELKSLCQNDERLLFRFKLIDSTDHVNFVVARDFIVEGILESIMRDYASMS